jgi:hypothetical protein
MRKALVTAVLLFALPAAADSLKAANAREVRVAVASRSQRALGVRASADGSWRVQLRGPGAGTAEIFDVTPGTPAITLMVPVMAGQLVLDGVRFAGGHVYHVVVRAEGQLASGFVYLYPEAKVAKEPRRAAAQRVRFDEGERPASGDDVIAPVKKAPL